MEPKTRQIKHPRRYQPVPVLRYRLGDEVERFGQEARLRGLQVGVGDEGVDLQEDVRAGGAPGAGDGDLEGGIGAQGEGGGV